MSRRKQGMLQSKKVGSAVTVNGVNAVDVSAGGNAFFDADGVNWSKGTYRFEKPTGSA